DVPQMPAAPLAVRLGADHEVALVGLGAHRAGQGGGEARPTGAALELGGCIEEGLAAAGAAKRARPLLVVQWAGARSLGTVLTEHLIGRGREPLLPLGVGARDGGLGAITHVAKVTQTEGSAITPAPE